MLQSQLTHLYDGMLFQEKDDDGEEEDDEDEAEEEEMDESVR